MFILSDYIAAKKIYEGDETFIYSGFRESDSQRIAIKLLKNHHPKTQEVARINHEYELLRKLKGDGTVRAYEFGKDQAGLPIVMEYFVGQTLTELLIKKKLTLKEFLILSILIIESLEKIHFHNIIHKNITPDNILVNLEKKQQVKMIDFAMATTLPEEFSHIHDILTFPVKTLQYISPELTGLINRSVDYRTDYYSIGVVFYQMLTGRLPFLSTDKNELINDHISKIPPTPIELDPTLPVTLSKIIMKLLSKTPEERYQSLSGLKYDLHSCLESLEHHNTIQSFQLAKYDILNKFSISKKLYGRDDDREELLKILDRACKGRAEFLFITTNFAGIGKSTLVGEVFKPLFKNQGHFISGKFDRFKRNVPYAALAQAIQSFIQQILTERKQDINLWKKWIQEALGPNGQVAVDLVPSLTGIIGEQPAVPMLGPIENQNRFNLVILNLIHALARPEHPLVIYLDDWQWADVSSIELIETFLLHPESRHVLIIASYRKLENENRITTASLGMLRKNQVSLNTIHLKPLQLNHIEEFLIDTLHQDEDKVLPLAEFLFMKTQGNPFFLKLLLRSLYEDNLLKCDSKNSWHWDITQINKEITTNTIHEIIINKIKKLSASTQRVLQLGACLGNRFDLKTLSMIAEDYGFRNINKEIWNALRHGIILPLSDPYTCKFSENRDDINIEYQFQHSYFQQAIYSLIEDENRNLFHLKIGRLLLNNTPKSKLNEYILEIVNQLNHGIDFIIEPEEKITLLELNLAVALKLKACIAYKEALNYLKTGIMLLKKESWLRQYKLTLTLYTEAAETAFLAAEFDDMNYYSEEVINRTSNLFDKIKIYEIRISYLSSKGKLSDAVNTALFVLNLLGIKLPNHPNYFQVVMRYIRVLFNLAWKKTDDLYDLPDMKNPRWQAAMRIFTAISAIAYIVNPKLFLIMTFESVRLSIKYGNAYESALAYANFAVVLCSFNYYEKGYQFGQLALRLLNHIERDDLKTKVWLVTSSFVLHWHDSMDRILETLTQGFYKCLEIGDIEYAGYTATCYAYQAFFSGNELNKISQEIKQYVNYLGPTGHKISCRYLAIYLQTITNLLESLPNQDVTQLSGEWFNENDSLTELFETNDGPGIRSVYINKLILSYLFEDYRNGYEYAMQALKYTDKVVSSFIIPVFYYYYSLVCLAIYSDADLKQKKFLLKCVTNNQIKMKHWAKLAPMNYLHKYYLVEAEKMHLLGKTNKASYYYDQAIKFAQQNKYLNDEALANELAFKFYLAHGREKIAKAYINDAYSCYMNWGANAKIRFLEERYSHLLSPDKIISHRVRGTPWEITTTSTVKTLTKNLDLATVMQATQAISREIELDNLLKKALNIIIQLTGAENGYVLFKNENKWFIEAKRTLDSQEVTIVPSLPFEDEALLPNTIIKEVIQSKKPIVLDNAEKKGRFTSDPYIKKYNAKSILCFPLIDQGVLSGILYIENNHVIQLFTQDKLELLNLLSAQLIISIDNTKLYARIKQFNEAYERFVPHELLNLLEKKSITEVTIGDQTQKDMTVMFCDIRGLQKNTNNIIPEEDLAVINHFLSYIEPIITMHHGFIDKYIGYSIMALFPHSADDALQCSIAMLKTLKRYNKEHRGVNHPPINIGIGLNSGLLMLGTVGDASRMDVTVISDIVNVASRVEELTNLYKVKLFITEDTLNRLQNASLYLIRKIDTVTVKGKSIPITLYEVLDTNAKSKTDQKNN